MKINSKVATTTGKCLLAASILVTICVFVGSDERHFKFSDEVLYLEDNICAMNATDERSDRQMRADVEECIRLRKESKE